MKKFLVTGFSGFVSHHFLEYLENRQIESMVKGLDICEPDFKSENYRSIKFDFEKIDLLDRGKVEKVILEFKPDYLLHLASFSSVAFSWREPVISFQNNTNIYLNILEAVRKTGFSSRILSIGSSEEYGDVDKNDLPLTEGHALKPISPYAVARVSQELLSQIYADGYGLDIVMTRSFNHIGPLQKEIFVVASFVKQLVQIKNKGGKGELIAGDLSIVRDFTDVRDVVSAYYLLLTEGRKGNLYNVCSGKGFSLKQIVYRICRILDIDVNIRLDPGLIRPSDNKNIVGSNEKIKKYHKWKPRYTLDKSLHDMIIYWQSQK